MMCLLETGPGNRILGWTIGTDAPDICRQLKIRQMKTFGSETGRYANAALDIEQRDSRCDYWQPGKHYFGNGFVLLVS